MIGIIGVVTQAGSNTSDARARLSLVSESASIDTLKNVVDDLARQTGTPLTVDRSIQNRCVTLVCSKRPLGEVMDRMAECLMLKWSPDDAGKPFRLTPTDDLRTEERLAQQVDGRRLQDQVTQALEYVESMAEASGADQAKLTQTAQERVQKLSSNPLSSDEELREANRALSVLRTASFGIAIKSMNRAYNEPVHHLLAGETLFASTRGRDRRTAAPLPASFTEGYEALAAQRNLPVSEIGFVNIVRIDPSGEKIEFSGRVSGLGTTLAGKPLTRIPLDDFGPPRSRTRLERHLDDWAKKSDPSVENRPVPASAFRSLRDPGYLQHAYAVGDHLRALASSTGICVVGDAFRIPCTSGPIAAQTVGQYMRELNQRRSLAFDFSPGWTRSDGGWLMYRHAQAWNLIRQLPTEEAMRSMEAKFSRTPRLTLNDYGAFPVALDDRQRRYLEGGAVVLSKFPIRPLRDFVCPLCLWGLLSGSQREQSFTPTGLRASEFNRAQAEMYRQCLSHAVWQARVPTKLLDDLLAGWPKVAEMSLFCRTMNEGKPSAYLDESIMGPPGGVSPTVLNKSTLLLGQTESDAIGIITTIDP